MSRWRVLAVACLTCSLLTGCLLGTRSTALEPISCQAFEAQGAQQRAVTLARGQALTVTLCSNPSTGFAWEDAQVSDPRVAEQTARASQQGQQAQGLAGAPGLETFTLRALQPGRVTVTWAYSRPWEGGEKAVWTLTLDLTVE